MKRCPPHTNASWKARLIAACLVASLAYVNVAAVLKPFFDYHGERKLPLVGRLVKFRLPISPLWNDAFTLFGVFSKYETVNREMVIYGRLADPGEGPRWISLDRETFFPVVRGEQSTRLYAGRRVGSLGRPAEEQQRFVLRKIRERYNRAHPEQRLAEVRVDSVEWPRSPQGFDAERYPHQMTVKVLRRE